ncbi:KIF-binding protein-like isoform X2 [Linepithema humile]|uniref:KIF-binding protein-like isoform X2 n=1 Tax=Linepithema humile TaxID=83485 RepID=UPI00351E3759
MSEMSEILKLADLYLSKQRIISGNNSEELTEKIMLNIDEKFREMLKTSFQILSFSLNKIGKFQKKENKIFTTLESKILKMIKPMTNKTDIEFDNIVAFALTLLNFGIISMKIEKKREQNTCSLYTEAEKFFLACLGVLEGKELDSKAILIVMNAYNEISFISLQQQKLEKHFKFLLRALNTYVKYTKNEYSTPIDVAITLGIGKDAKELDTKMALDNFYIETLKTLSTEYIYNPDNMVEFVNCMHNLLNNLIKEESIRQYYKDWAMTAADLSLYFIHHNRFTEARHYIATAYCMLKKANVETLKKMTETTINDKDSNLLSNTLCTEYPYEYAKIAKLCGQYGIQLLHASKEKLLPSKENQSCQVDNLECSNSTKSEEKSAQCLIFTDLEEELKDEISFTQISDKYLSNLSDIKTVFEKVIAWFEIAIKYFTMEKDATIHGAIILYISRAYKCFAGFEQDKDKRMIIYKKQIALLFETVQKLPHETFLYNTKTFMWLELGITYLVLFNILGDDITISDVKTDRELLSKIEICFFM